MKLNKLINCNYDIEIKGIKTNSNQVKNGDLFICTDYGTMDRHLFIDDAIKKGASAIIVKKDIQNKSLVDKEPGVRYGNPTNIRMEIRCGNSKNLELKYVLVDYLKTP